MDELKADTNAFQPVLTNLPTVAGGAAKAEVSLPQLSLPVAIAFPSETATCLLLSCNTTWLFGI